MNASTSTDNPNQALDDLITHTERKRNVLIGVATLVGIVLTCTIAGPPSVMISALDVMWVISITWIQLAFVIIAGVLCIWAHSVSDGVQHLKGVSRKDS